jgi:hypothetical protein
MMRLLFAVATIGGAVAVTGSVASGGTAAPGTAAIATGSAAVGRVAGMSYLEAEAPLMLAEYNLARAGCRNL